MDDGFENREATWEKALVDEANKRERATAREKALTDELRLVTALEKALADEANERRRADTRKKVFADKQGGQELAVRGSLLKTVRQRARPCIRVGRRHGPRTPNTQEYLLCGRRHWPRPPKQSTGNGWA